MQYEAVDASEWSKDLKLYQSQKKTHFQFNESTIPKIITQKDVKLRETQFHPILQKFANGKRESNERQVEQSKVEINVQRNVSLIKPYMHEYNLITLNPVNGISRPDEKERIKQNMLPANFNDYNIITNQRFDESYLKNLKVFVPTNNKEKSVINRQTRDYNIITNKYQQDHELRAQVDQVKRNDEIYERERKLRNFNAVTVEYFDEEKEKDFLNNRHDEQLNHGKDFSRRFPPSWKFRESVYLDQTKDVPEEIIMIDQINRNKKKRYQLRHVIEEEYRERNIEQQERGRERLKHFVKYEDLEKKYDKEFDIITNKKPEIDHIVQQFPPKPAQNSWEKSQMNRILEPDSIDQEVRFYNEGVRENIPHEIQPSMKDIKGKSLYVEQKRNQNMSSTVRNGQTEIRLPQLHNQPNVTEKLNSQGGVNRIKTGGFFQMSQ